MEFSENDRKYLSKLRMDFPKSDIPTDQVVENILLKMNGESEEVVGELIIRIWDDDVDFELM